MKVSEQKWKVVSALAELLRLVDNSEELFPLIVTVISELLQVGICSLMIEEHGRLRIRAAQGVAPEIIEKTALPIGEGVAGWVYLQQTPLLIEDIETDQRFHRHSLEKYYTHSLLSIPLVVGNESVGVLNINNKFDHTPFHQEDLESAMLVGEMVALAVRQAKTYDQSTRRLQELESLYAANKLFSSTLELKHILSAILGEIAKLVPLRGAIIFILDENTGGYNVGADELGESLDQDACIFTPELLPPAVFADIFAQHQVVKIDDLDLLRRMGWPQKPPALLIPLITENKVMGLILVYPEVPKIPGTHRISNRFLHFLGNAAALAIKNAALYQNVNRRMIELFSTNQALAEKTTELDDLNRYNKSIIEGLTSGLLVLNPEGTVLTCNRAAQRILRIDQTQVLNKRLEDAPIPSNFVDAVNRLRLQNDETIGHELLLEFPDLEKPLFVGLSITPFSRGMIVRFRDLSELKRLQEQVIWSEKLASIGLLAAGVAHELNNPLGAISGYIQLLLQGESDQEEQHKYLSEILEEIKRISGVVRNLLDFSRQSDECDPAIDLGMLIDKTVTLLRPQLEKNGITVTHLRSEMPALVSGNVAQLRALLLNLILNATQSVEEDVGEIVISDFCEKQHAGVTISDNGVGIPQDELERIFEPFYTRRRGTEVGTGLGLSIARKIVREHRGDIAVTSELGGGTEFTIKFPCAGVTNE